MSNNNNSKANSSDISTRKSFLISLPGKKNLDASQSSIHLANPKSENSKNDFNNNKNNNNNNRNNKHKDNRNTANNKGFDKKKKDKNNKGFNKNNPQENNPQKFGAQQAPNVSSHNSNNINNNSNSNGNNNGKNHKRNDRKNRKFKDNRQKYDNRNNRDNFRENKDRNNKNQNQNQNINNGSTNNQKDVKPINLSALSEDIVKAQPSTKPSTPDFVMPQRELTLEEKYKNAKPLAQQIAEQEMRSKGIKIPQEDTPVQPKEDSEKVDVCEIVGVRFREAGKIYYFDPDSQKIPFGTAVIVETARGNEYGFVAISNRFVPCESLTSPLKKIKRIATEIDTQKHVANRTLEAQAEEVFKEKVEKLGLEMSLVFVEYTFDNSRLLFYFTAETRIDFRELVKELASVFRTRIELRQIGVRDEAKSIGGIGVCGRAVCCNTFLGDFAQVSIKMAKDQSLSLNAAKISGSCGKLMCCLRYEDKVYEEENARTPKVGSVVETPEGKGHVVERSALKGEVKVQLDLTPDMPAKVFSRDDVKVVGFNKQKEEQDDDSLKELEDAE